MRKIVVLSFLTLDGVMQAPGGPEEDSTGDFKHGGWSVGYWDDSLASVMGQQMSGPFDLLLGRKTYEIFAAHWPNVKDDFAAKLNKAKKHVVSRTLSRVDWAKFQPRQGRCRSRNQEAQGPRWSRTTGAW